MVESLGDINTEMECLLFNCLTRLSVKEKILIKLIIIKLEASSPVTELSVLDYAIETGIELDDAISSIETTAFNLFCRYLKAPFFDVDESYQVTSRWLDFYSSVDDLEEPVIRIKLSDVLVSVVNIISTDKVIDILDGLTSSPSGLLSNSYAVRLYNFLVNQGFGEKGSVEVSLDELRSVLEVNSDKYKTIQNFKLRVLHPMIDDLNSQLSLGVSYSDVRGISGSSRITGFVFSKQNTPTK